MLIDSHVHLWSLDRGDYEWPTPATPALYRDFALADYDEQTADLDVSGIVLVQAAETVAETDWLLDQASGDPRILGVVGWVDLRSPDVVDVLAARVSRKLVAVRPMLQDQPDIDWISSAAATRGFEAIQSRDLVFEALARPAQLSAIEALAGRYPKLRIVLDHGGKPGHGFNPLVWANSVSKLADHANVSCKLSGLVTQQPAGASSAMISDIIAHLTKAFSNGRLLWGSDWPVVTERCRTAEWLKTCRSAAKALDDTARASLFGGAACRVYKLELPREL